MPLMPNRVKYRKQQRGSRSGFATSNTELAQGDFGLKTLDRAWLTAVQIEACRVAINRHLKRRGKLWIRVFPDKPVSKKPIEVRMGKGKGNPEFWVAVVRPGIILFELAGVPDSLAREAMRFAASKLGVRTVLVSRNQKA
jgi:ribosomal protein L16, bacterial/organelle